MLTNPHGRERLVKFTYTLVLGLFLGGLLTKLVEIALPAGTASSEFLLTSVNASLGPLSVDLVALAFVVGPITLSLNFLTVVGIATVATVVRSML